MAFVNLLLIGFLNFLGPSKEPLDRQHYPPGLTGTLIDLARLAKGRVLVCFVKEGMTVEEVHRILGRCDAWSGSLGHIWSSWHAYGISVGSFAPEGLQYKQRVTSVDWSLPSEYEWIEFGFWNFLAPIQAADKKSEGDGRLETLLQEWKKADHQIRELHCTFTVTTEDRVLKDRETRRGEVFFKKPDLVRIDMKDTKGKLFEIWLYRGKTIRRYSLTTQIEEARLTELDASLDWLTMWISGLLKSARWASTAVPFDETQKRFHFHLNKEDKYWAYIQLEPRNPQEFVDFKEMEVVLNQKTHLARQVRWLIANGNRMILDFDKVEINPTPPITWESISKDLPKKLKKVSVPEG